MIGYVWDHVLQNVCLASRGRWGHLGPGPAGGCNIVSDSPRFGFGENPRDAHSFDGNSHGCLFLSTEICIFLFLPQIPAQPGQEHLVRAPARALGELQAVQGWRVACGRHLVGLAGEAFFCYLITSFYWYILVLNGLTHNYLYRTNLPRNQLTKDVFYCTRMCTPKTMEIQLIFALTVHEMIFVHLRTNTTGPLDFQYLQLLVSCFF